MRAREPWSGHWSPGQGAAASAALTQFTSAQPGLCAWLPNSAVGEDGILSSDCDVQQLSDCVIAAAVDCGRRTGHGQTVVIETARHGQPINVTARVEGVQHGAQWQLWQACSGESDVSKWLHKSGPPMSGTELSFRAEASCTYTLTTSAVETAWSVSNASIPPSTPMPLPYADDFSKYQEGQQVRFFTAESGSFEGAVSSLVGTTPVNLHAEPRMVMRQQVEKRPIEW